MKISIKMTKQGMYRTCDGVTRFDPNRELEASTDGKTIWFNAPCSSSYSEEGWNKVQRDNYYLTFTYEIPDTVKDPDLEKLEQSLLVFPSESLTKS